MFMSERTIKQNGKEVKGNVKGKMKKEWYSVQSSKRK